MNEVMVEYDTDYPGTCDSEGNTNYHLVVEYNNVNISMIKDSYTRKEVIKIAMKAFEDSCKYTSFKDFINENL